MNVCNKIWRSTCPTALYLVKAMTYKDSHDVVDPLPSRSTVVFHVHIILQNLPFLNCSYHFNAFLHESVVIFEDSCGLECDFTYSCR